MNEKEKMHAIQNRDSSYDGNFIFGVKTMKNPFQNGAILLYTV